MNKSEAFVNKTWEKIEYVGKESQLNEFGDELIQKINVFQDKPDVCRITEKEVKEIIEIIRENQNGHLIIYGESNGCEKLRKIRVGVWFIRRKKRFAVRVFIQIKSPEIFAQSQKYLNKHFDLSLLLTSNVFRSIDDEDFLYLMKKIFGVKRINKISDYLLFRQKREMLFKAAKAGIDISELKKILKIQRRIKDNVRISDVIKFIDFKEPCLLLIGFELPTEKWILYTPFGNYESKKHIYDARVAFRHITGARCVPRGKDATKKIEALLIQASI
ncbi:hypothetical protein [Thermicanus aegyptius]|uniref:hypothetical protein n=1 Tax=Thermicanus aegyptius TaxID=94009 RepID=UPI00040F619A|nr:hypothetical protein [Thermicanus aegyptius]